MNQTTTIYDAAKETLEIFRHFDTAFVSQVPSEFLAELEQFASQSTKAFQVDLQKRLMEQELSEEAKDLLSFLYYSYGASEAEKRQERSRKQDTSSCNRKTKYLAKNTRFMEQIMGKIEEKGN